MVSNISFRRGTAFKKRFRKERELWVWTILAMIWLVIFFLIPLYGISYAFFNYVPGRKLSMEYFVGLENFRAFFKNPNWIHILRNTLIISGLNLSIGFVAPIILAFLFDELANINFKRVTQTISYLPYFVSWVVVASIMTTFLSSEGIMNEMMMKLGFTEKPIGFLTEGKYFYGIITFANIWKGIGWQTILYMSAIAGIDQELYQAGAVDGLGRFGMVWRIKLPSILPTILLIFILSTGSVLNAGFEQQLLLGQESTRDYWEVIDTYVYRYGIQLGRYSFSIAVGLMKSVIGAVLVVLTNHISRKLTDMSIL